MGSREATRRECGRRARFGRGKLFEALEARALFSAAVPTLVPTGVGFFPGIEYPGHAGVGNMETAVQPDGKIVVAGQFGVPGAADLTAQAMLVRFNADQTLDTDFGSGSFVMEPGVTRFSAVAVAPGGKIYAIGNLGAADSDGKVLMRFLPGGQLDASFGNRGSLAIGADTADFYQVAVSPQGEIVLTGVPVAVTPPGETPTPMPPISSGIVERLNGNGTPDQTFNHGRILEVAGIGTSVVQFMSGGKILLSGSVETSTSAGKQIGFSLVRLRADGTPDASFGSHGVVNTFFNNPEAGRSFLGFGEMTTSYVQSDGKIVMAGTGLLNEFLMVRYNADGSLDTSFGAGGIVRNDGLTDIANSIRPSAGGGYAVAGYSQNYSGVTYARLAKNGALVGVQSSPELFAGQAGYPTHFELLMAGAVEPDGTPVAFGLLSVSIDDNLPPDQTKNTIQMFAESFTPDSTSALPELPPVPPPPPGYQPVPPAHPVNPPAPQPVTPPNSIFGPDTGLGTAGAVRVDVAGKADGGMSIVSLAGGKILVAGNATLDNGTSVGMLLQLLADGSPDTSFGNGGMVMDTRFLKFTTVAADPGGGIVALGNTRAGTALTHFNADGSVESSFAGSGMAPITQANTYYSQLAFEPDGTILAAGYGIVGTGVPRFAFALGAWNADGSPDADFAGGGFENISFPGDVNIEFLGTVAKAMAVSNDGKILLGGFDFAEASATTGNLGFALTRLNANGAPDMAFGKNGQVVTFFQNAAPGPIAVDRGEIDAILVQGDGSVVVAGSSETQLLLARYTADGSLDQSFADHGIATVNNGVDGDGLLLRATPGGGYQVVTADALFSATFSQGGVLMGSASGTPGQGSVPHGLVSAFAGDGTLISTGTTGSGDAQDIVVAKFDMNAPPVVEPPVVSPLISPENGGGVVPLLNNESVVSSLPVAQALYDRPAVAATIRTVAKKARFKGPRSTRAGSTYRFKVTLAAPAGGAAVARASASQTMQVTDSAGVPQRAWLIRSVTSHDHKHVTLYFAANLPASSSAGSLNVNWSGQTLGTAHVAAARVKHKTQR